MKSFDPARILYQDGSCVVINKAAGEDAEHFPLRAVHRLDVPVSGCLLFARTPDALAFLGSAFARGLVDKRYWAILEAPETAVPGREELVHWIRWNPRSNKSAAFGEAGPGRKRAALRCRIIGRGERYLFMEIKLLTGRHHQIRAQLAALGLHIKGDLKYGARRSEKEGGIRLHARSLTFPNPSGGDAPVHVTAAPPLRDRLWEDFGALYGPEQRIW